MKSFFYHPHWSLLLNIMDVPRVHDWCGCSKCRCSSHRCLMGMKPVTGDWRCPTFSCLPCRDRTRWTFATAPQTDSPDLLAPAGCPLCPAWLGAPGSDVLRLRRSPIGAPRGPKSSLRWARCGPGAERERKAPGRGLAGRTKARARRRFRAVCGWKRSSRTLISIA